MKPKGTTPVRGVLRAESPLQAKVKDGLGAVETAHKKYFNEAVRTKFADSLDIDAGLKAGHESDNRWDYLLGHAPSGKVIAVEPHHADNHEVTTVIAKRTAAKDQLAPHLREGAIIDRWLWVSSGKVHFSPMDKKVRQLDQAGITFVGKEVQAKHLPAASAPKPAGKPATAGTQKVKS